MAPPSARGGFSSSSASPVLDDQNWRYANRQENPPLRVVGIMPSVKHSLGDPRPSMHVYVPLGQHYESAMTLQIRLAGKGGERAMMGTIARIVRSTGVNGIEPVVLVIAPLILVAAPLLASPIPAFRATRVDPTVVLRSE